MVIRYNSDISLEADIAESVYFSHNGFGTVINPRTQIGEKTVIQHSVTCGGR